MDSVSADFRSGYVTLIGRPNAGKSTLMNAFLGQKLSIVTRKPQTTRHRVLGILSEPTAQIIFLDTPGILQPRYGLQRAMMRAVHGAAAEADVLLFLVDVTKSKPAEYALRFARPETPTILVLNKMDLVPQAEALPLVEAYTALRSFTAVVPISAKTGFNADRLKAQIIQHLPFGPPFYTEDVLSAHPERFFVSEIIREKIFQLYSQEIPYATQVNITAFEERANEKDFIDAEIVVERASQKGILIGKQGKALKRVGTAARKDIEALLDRPVYLQLHVKVRDDWRNRDTLLRAYGYEG